MIIILLPFFLSLTFLFHFQYKELEGKDLQIISIKNPDICPASLEEYLYSSSQKNCLPPLSDHRSESGKNGGQELLCLLLKYAEITSESYTLFNKGGKKIICP